MHSTPNFQLCQAPAQRTALPGAGEFPHSFLSCSRLLLFLLIVALAGCKPLEIIYAKDAKGNLYELRRYGEDTDDYVWSLVPEETFQAMKDIEALRKLPEGEVKP